MNSSLSGSHPSPPSKHIYMPISFSVTGIPSRHSQHHSIHSSLLSFSCLFTPFSTWEKTDSPVLTVFMYVINTQECNRQGCRGAFPDGTTPPPGGLHASCLAHPLPDAFRLGGLPHQVGGRPLRTAFSRCPSSSPCKHTLLLPSWASDVPCPVPGVGATAPLWMPASHPCSPRTLTLTPVRAAFLPASVTCSPLGNLVKNADYWVPLPEVMTQSIDTR